MKTKTSHTPGPWVVARNRPYLVMHVIANNADFNGKSLVVANCDYQQTLAGGSKLSNARLIASAPELLAACRAALMDLIDDATFGEHQTTIKTLQSAILKAEGSNE